MPSKAADKTPWPFPFFVAGIFGSSGMPLFLAQPARRCHSFARCAGMTPLSGAAGHVYVDAWLNLHASRL
jgi:hypothetical protein